MAVDASDPRAFQSWEDAFQYPIPAVRGLEKKVRNYATENQDKVRTLVGASYRDLLGTAKTIVRVNDQTHQVESGLLQICTRSDSRIATKINANFEKFEMQCRLRDKEHLAFGSQVVLLQHILRKVSELLHVDQSSLVVAKLLVIARLLVKTISDCTNQFPILEKLRMRLVSQRHRLLARIDQKLAQSGHQAVDIANYMSAFSLVTSAVPTDVLKHYHQIRLAQIQRDLEDHSMQGLPSPIAVIRKLRDYLETVQLSRDIFPKILSELLKQLASQPLVQDTSIHDIIGLDFDVLGKWFSNDVLNFTPWLQHAEMDSDKASQLIEAWAREAINFFIKYVDLAVKRFDFTQVAQTRKETFEIWLSSNQRFQIPLTTLEVIAKLNVPFTARFIEIVRSYFENLDSISAIIEEGLERLNLEAHAAPLLWTDSIISLDVGGGAVAFREAIVTGRSGMNESLRKIIYVYEQCNANIIHARKILKDMHNLRWDDFLDDVDSELESENILSLLVPPAAQGSIEAELKAAAQITSAKIDKSMLDIIKKEMRQEEGSEVEVGTFKLQSSLANNKAASLVRIIRELRSRLPKLFQEQADANVPEKFCEGSIEVLHKSLVHNVTRNLPTFVHGPDMMQSSSPAYLDLWAGSPPAPVQPAVPTFKFLRSLVRDMENIGADIWSPNLVFLLKRTLRLKILKDTERFVDDLRGNFVIRSIPNEPVDAVDTARDTLNMSTGKMERDIKPTEAVKATSVQLLFDLYYVQYALSLPQEEEGTKDAGRQSIKSDYQGHAAAILERCFEMEETQLKRIRKNAKEYWRRTYLLFGLLN